MATALWPHFIDEKVGARAWRGPSTGKQRCLALRPTPRVTIKESLPLSKQNVQVDMPPISYNAFFQLC